MGRGGFAGHVQRALGVFLIVVFPTACGNIPGLGPAPEIYMPAPDTAIESGVPAVPWQLLVEEPVAPATIDTQRIALKTSKSRFAYYADRRWADRAPLIMQTLLIETFENSGSIVSIGRDSIGLRSDYLLKTELRDFQAEYEGDPGGTEPVVHVTLNIKLVRMPKRDIVASRNFEVRVRAVSPRFEAVIEAFNVALERVLADAVVWSLTTAEADASGAPRPARAVGPADAGAPAQ